MTESDEEASVIAANEAFYQAFNQKDAAAMEGLWADSEAISCIHPGWNALKGRDAVIESWTNILNNPGQTRIVTGGATVSFFGDLALVLCRELVGGSPLIATNIFIRQAGDWRLLHHQSGPVYNGG